VLNPGESCFELIDRACRQVGLLPVSDGIGGFLLDAGGQRRGDGVSDAREVNVLKQHGRYDASKRYAKYIVLAQQPRH
jgi:prophage tail gpP-like protein